MTPLARITFWYDRETYTNAPIVTYCKVEREGLGDNILYGEAICHPLDQPPCKERGRKIALGRALSPLTYPERKAIWEQYFQRKSHGHTPPASPAVG